jgi:threonine aldolase
MNSSNNEDLNPQEQSVFFYGDDAPSYNVEFINHLNHISESKKISEDNYSIGGEVERLETTMAQKLGKEASVFFPTGTLANHVAIRQLCLSNKRAIVPEQSHIYQDSGDAVQQLSGINLIPLGPNKPYFGLDELKGALNTSISGRVTTPVGAVVIETPVRRCYGRVMPYEAMKDVTGYCHQQGIPTHLDGARLLIASVVTKISLEAYSNLFDTVYISMWKYFGAPYGAVLAGSKEFCENLYHVRRMFGGSLPSASLAAALALNGLETFQTDAELANEKSAELLESLDKFPDINVKPYQDGSNIIPVEIDQNVDLAKLYESLRSQNVFINTNTESERILHLTMNLSVLRRPNNELLRIFAKAIEDARSI